MNELDLGCREASVGGEADGWAGGCDALLQVYLECHMVTRSPEEGRRSPKQKCSQVLQSSRLPISVTGIFLKVSEWQDLMYGFQRDSYLDQTGKEARGGCRDGPGQTSLGRAE